MPDSIQSFEAFRARMNQLLLGAGNLTINRFFALDQRAYEPGALGSKTKEMLGLVSSLEFLEVFSVGLVVGGSIVIPHLRRAMARLEEISEAPPTPA